MLRKVEEKESAKYMAFELVDAVHPLMEVEFSIDVMEVFSNSNAIARSQYSLTIVRIRVDALR